MALIKCKECGHQVSSNAKACPGCGAKVIKPAGWLGVTLVVIIAIAIFLPIINNDGKQQRQTSIEAIKTPAQIAATAKIDAQLQLAAMGALTLKKAMKDPDAFTLTSVDVKESGAACYEYRAKNGFGAIFPGSAILTRKGKMLSREHDGNAFVHEWNKECTVSGGTDIAALIKQLGILK